MARRLLENEGRIIKEHKETFGDDRFIHYLDSSAGLTGVKAHWIVHFKYAWFPLCQLHLNKALFLKIITQLPLFPLSSSHCYLQEAVGSQGMFFICFIGMGMDILSRCLWE